jgi:hypothetical protein
MKPYTDKSTNETGQTEFSIHALSGEEYTDIIKGLHSLTGIMLMRDFNRMQSDEKELVKKRIARILKLINGIYREDNDNENLRFIKTIN